MGYNSIEENQRGSIRNIPSGCNKKIRGAGKHPITQGFSNGPQKFNKTEALFVKSYLYEIFSKDWRFEIVPDLFTQRYGNELKRWMSAVETYCMNPRSKISKEELTSNFDNINYSSYLKKLRTKSFIYSRDLILLDESPEDKNIKPIKIDSIDEIFNYAYWFFWEEEEPKDYEKGFIPLNPRTKEFEKEFKEAGRSILPDNIPTVFEEEILLSNSSSSAIDDLNKEKKSKVYKLKEYQNKFSDKPLEGKRCIIPVHAQNYRDSILLSVPQSNSVKLIEKQLSEICQKIDYSAHFKNPKDVLDNLDKFWDDHTYFLDRDIEKEGITKPRILIKWILDILEEKYPEFPCWKYRGIYDDYFLILENGERINPIRGHGLGMGNSLTTIMQCITFEVTLQRFIQNENVEGKLGARFFNDDCTIGFESEDDFESFDQYEDKVFEDLSLVRKKSKSHRGFSFVFCEIYFPNQFNNKEIYSQIAISNIFSACNIAHAKMISSNLNDFISDEDIQSTMSDILSFWGFEFCIEESEYPTTFGGWFSPLIMGVRTDLYHIPNPPTSIMNRLYKACLNDSIIIQRSRKKDSKLLYNDPISQIYGEIYIPHKYLSMLNMNTPRNKIQEKFQSWSNRESVEKAMDSLLHKRYSTFEKEEGKCLLLKDYLELLEDRYPEKDILPLPEMVKGEMLLNEIFEKKKTNYRNPNPLMSFLEYHNPGKISNKVIPEEFSFKGINPSSKSLSATDRRRLSFIFSGWRTNRFYHTIFSLEEKTPKEEFFWEWKDAISVTTAYSILNHKEVFPLKYSTGDRFKRNQEYDKTTLSIILSDYFDSILKIIERIGYKKFLKIYELDEEELNQFYTLLKKENKVEEIFNDDQVETSQKPENFNEQEILKAFRPWDYFKIEEIAFGNVLNDLPITCTIMALLRATDKYRNYIDAIGFGLFAKDTHTEFSLEEDEEEIWLRCGGSITILNGNKFPIITSLSPENQEEEIIEIDFDNM